MQIKTKTPFQTFNDGVCGIYAKKNIAEKGNRPVWELKKKESRIPYEKRRVGLTRFTDARQDNVDIELLLRIPGAYNVSALDVCIVGGIQYGVYQVQDVLDTMPAAKDIALKRLEARYDITGV